MSRPPESPPPPPGPPAGPPPGPPAGPPPGPPYGPQGYWPGGPPPYGYPQHDPSYGPSPYAPPMPPPLPPYPHARREPYHRILRTWSYHFWRVLAGVLLTVLGAFLAPLPMGLLVGLVVQMLGVGSVAKVFHGLGLQGRLDPPTLLAINLSLAMLIPISWLAIRFLHNLRPRWLGSVRPRLRWSLVGWFFAASLVSTALAYLVAGLLFPSELPSSGGGGGGGGFAGGATTVAFLVIIALTSPLQAAGEEYFFRGYLLQCFGALVRAPWFTVICTSLLFATAHGSQNLPLFIDRFAFGLVAGGLVIFTGGIEAGIAMHMVNNVVVLGFAAAAGTLTQTLGTSAAGWTAVAVDMGQFVLYGGFVVLMCRRLRPQRLTPGPPEGEVSAAASAPTSGA